MKVITRHLCSLATVGSFSVLIPTLSGQDTAEPKIATETHETVAPYLSLTIESKGNYAKGIAYLKSQQQEEGHWGDPNIPAITALALTAALRDPSYDHGQELPDWLAKGYKFIRSNQKTDGGIYGKGLATYNTSLSIMALLALDNEADRDLIIKARTFLINQQTDWGNKGETDDVFDGGIGYGGTYAHSDMSNTYLALEALYHSRKLVKNEIGEKHAELDWEGALQFVSRCQNLPETNDQNFASDDTENKGGFIYFPGSSKAGESELADGGTALRSYGSMSYAGLLSLIYADLEEDDPRLESVLDWIGRNYTLDENPGLGQQGLYYYYQTIAKSLAAANVEMLEIEGDKVADWRRELTTRLLTSQREDGSWINENSRWWENDPVLVTSYALISLSQLHEIMQ